MATLTDAFAAGLAAGAMFCIGIQVAWSVLSTSIESHRLKRSQAEEELESVRREQLKQAIRAEIVAELGLDDDELEGEQDAGPDTR